MISYEINLVCEKAIPGPCSIAEGGPQCEGFYVSDPTSRINLKSFLVKARKIGWQVSSNGRIAFCPSCVKYLDAKKGVK